MDVKGSDFPDCLAPEIHRERVKFDLGKYCRGLTLGDVEQFCKAAPTPLGASWFRLRYRARVMLLREFYAAIPLPGEPDDKIAELFLIENDAGGYLK